MTSSTKSIRKPLLVLVILLWTTVTFFPWLSVHLLLNAFKSKRKIQVWRQFWHNLWAKVILKLIRCEVNVIGNPKHQGVVIVSNHLSYLDILIYSAVFNVIFVSKSEIAAWPFVGFIGKHIGTIFINRRDKKDILRVSKEIDDLIERRFNILIFPEATSTDGLQVVPFKASLFNLPATKRLPVLPCAITYNVPTTAKPATHSVCWWGDMRFGHHFWSLLDLPKITAYVTISEDTKLDEDRKRLSKECYEVINSYVVK